MVAKISKYQFDQAGDFHYYLILKDKNGMYDVVERIMYNYNTESYGFLYDNTNLDVLKVGHHGSNTSSSYEFLKYIRPKFAVISCGLNNKYNHPSASVIDTLNSLKYSSSVNSLRVFLCPLTNIVSKSSL